jgi:E3 ubiquitin-protein ligase HERC2
MGMKLENVNFGAAAITTGASIEPTLNPNVLDVIQVVCRASKTLALTRSGEVYSWGSCENNSLGHGEGQPKVHRPKKIEVLQGIKIAQISANETSSAAVSEEGDVYTWGWGGSWWKGNGGLGHGDSSSQPSPALVESLEKQRVKVVSVSVGLAHMLALTSQGQVLSWGNGEFGRLGNGKREQRVPEPVELLASKQFVQISAGSVHSLALTNNGELYGWGKNDAGQLGQGGQIVADLNTMEEYPLLIESTIADEFSGESGEVEKSFKGHVTHISAGNNHSLAVTKDGSVYQWGQRTFLQPSLVEYGYCKDEGSSNERSVKLKGAKVEAGDGVSAVVDQSGQLFTWGRNLNSGMLGNNPYGFGGRRPVRVEAFRSMKVTASSFGSKHAGAVAIVQ